VAPLQLLPIGAPIGGATAAAPYQCPEIMLAELCNELEIESLSIKMIIWISI